MSKSYKYWYRQAQSVLEYYHDCHTAQEQKKGLLQLALNSLTNCLSCIERVSIHSLEEIKNVTRGVELQDDEIETIIMRLRGELEQFRSSVYALICYVSLGLQLYRRVVMVGQRALEGGKMDSVNRLNIMYYIIEAELSLGRSNHELQPYISSVQVSVSQYFKLQTRVVYSKRGQESYDSVDYETIFYFQLISMFIGEGNHTEALKSLELLRRKLPLKNTEYLRDAIGYLHLKYHFDKRYMHPFRTAT